MEIEYVEISKRIDEIVNRLNMNETRESYLHETRNQEINLLTGKLDLL